MDSNLSPKRLFDIGFSFTASRTLLTALELDLFELLTEPKTAEQIRFALDLHPRAIPDFPDALVALGVIEGEGDGEDRKYSNTPESEAFLVRSSPQYSGGMLLMSAKRLYSYWGHFTDALCTGEVQNEANKRNVGSGDSKSFWDGIYASNAKLESFLEGMRGMNTAAHRKFAKLFDFTKVATLLDVGGASGQLCIEVAKENVEVNCISMDLPNVSNVALKNVRKNGLESRIRVLPGDMFNKDVKFPNVDVIVMGMILHDYGEEEKLELMRKAYVALNDGGRFVAIEMLIDNERRKAIPALLMSLNMLIETKSGFDYSASQFDKWTKQVGFLKSERVDLDNPIHAVVAYK